MKARMKGTLRCCTWYSPSSSTAEVTTSARLSGTSHQARQNLAVRPRKPAHHHNLQVLPWVSRGHSEAKCCEMSEMKVHGCHWQPQC